MTENQSNDVQDPAEPKKVDVSVETTDAQPVSNGPSPDEPTETTVEKTETVTEKPADSSDES